MRIRLYYTIAVLFCFLSFSCTTFKAGRRLKDELAASSLQPTGRYSLNNKGHLELISSGAHVGFSFIGKECHIYANLPQGGHGYLQWELDGVYQQRVRINANDKEPIIIKADGKKRHTVWLYKASEAHSGPIALEKVKASLVSILIRPATPVIEFIGNSITSGAAADPSAVPCGKGEYHDQHNAYAAYGPRVARALGVNFVLNSVSGIGVYRNWNSDGPTMPQVYEYTDFKPDTGQRWNPYKFTPQIISIALGTNDFSNGDGSTQRAPFDSESFVSNYIDFVKKLKATHSYAKIALLSSPMISGDNGALLEQCLTRVKKEIDAAYPDSAPVALHFFKPMQPKGCSGHPSVEDHAVMAEELTPFFREMLGR
jgi:hypothetical protein